MKEASQEEILEKIMRLLFCGDVVGRPGRAVLTDRLPQLIDEYAVDFTVINGENATHGFGLNKNHGDMLFGAGADVITLGNHAFDQQDILTWIDQSPNVIRPQNIARNAPGKGCVVATGRNGHQVLVMNVLGAVGMNPLYGNPFDGVDSMMPPNAPVACGLDAVVLDFHAEITAEKQTMGHYVDGRVTLCIGTHTHIPTADTRVLPGGTAYQTDAGMCGDYDSSIGMDKGIVLQRMTGTLPPPRMEPAKGQGTLSGVLVDTDPKTGLAKQVVPLRIGGELPTSYPQLP